MYIASSAMHQKGTLHLDAMHQKGILHPDAMHQKGALHLDAMHQKGALHLDAMHQNGRLHLDAITIAPVITMLYFLKIEQSPHFSWTGPDLPSSLPFTFEYHCLDFEDFRSFTMVL